MPSEKLHQTVEKFISKKMKVKCETCPQRYGESPVLSTSEVQLWAVLNKVFLFISQLLSIKPLMVSSTCKTWRDWPRQCCSHTSSELQTTYVLRLRPAIFMPSSSYHHQAGPAGVPCSPCTQISSQDLVSPSFMDSISEILQMRLGSLPSMHRLGFHPQCPQNSTNIFGD